MRLLLRYFFKTAHYIIGPIILLLDALTPPKGMVRADEAQRQVDASTRNLVLYQFRMCPFSVKVRRTVKRLSLNIETRDALREPSSREELLRGGGKIKVPCLRITNEQGDRTWMYESSTITAYLRAHYT
jgi:glutaredoxin